MAMQVTATQGGSTGNGMMLRVFVLTGAKPAASQTGAAVNQQVSASNTWTQSITTSANSNVYGVAAPFVSGLTLTGSNATIVDQISDATNGATYGTWHALNVTAGATVRGFTTTNTPTGPMAQLEILAATTLAEDGSAPGPQNTTGAGPLVTASFTPPAGSLLVALVTSNGGAAQTTFSVTGGGLSWAQKSVNNPAGGDYAGVWIADGPAAAAAGAPPPLLTPPGLASPMVLAEPARFTVPPAPQQQPAPAPQLIPPGLASPMSLGVPARPATQAPPAPVNLAQIPPPLLTPPGLASPMVLAQPQRPSPPAPPQQQPVPAPQPVPPGLQSPMSLGVPARPATQPPPAPPVVGVASPAPQLTPPGLASPMSLGVPARPATQAPPAPPVITQVPGTSLIIPPGRMSPMSLGLPLVQPPQAPSTPGPPAPTPPIPSGVVFGGQSAGGDRDPWVREFRSIMPGEIPSVGGQIPRLHGRAAPAPAPRADDLEHLWEEPSAPTAPKGPGIAEIVSGEAQRAGSALYGLGKILAPEPYVPPSRVKCGAIRKIGTETLRCSRKRGHPGLHSDRGVKWG